MIRVLLADDHPVVRSGYLRLLDQTGNIRVVCEAGDGEAAHAGWLATQPDVVVTDISMPGGGLELIRRLLQRDPRARVLVFSMHDGAGLVAQALAAGAAGYVTKGSAPECLLDAVRTVFAGRRYLSPDIAPLQQRRAAEPELQRMAELSVREFETFRLLAQGRSVDECATALCLSPKTISNHQTLIKEKLGVATLAALAHLALRHGVISAPGASFKA
jgi:DNA-binding NarL/FixJ family response regulator